MGQIINGGAHAKVMCQNLTDMSLVIPLVFLVIFEKFCSEVYQRSQRSRFGGSHSYVHRR